MDYQAAFMSASDWLRLEHDPGPATILYNLITGAVATTKGNWTRWFPFRKGSFEVLGITTATCRLLASNAPVCPLNGKTLTVAGSGQTTGDVLTVTINGPGFTIAASYTVLSSDDTYTKIATGLAAALKAAKNAFIASGANDVETITRVAYLTITSAAAVVTIQWQWPLEGVQIVTALSVSATETLTAAEYDSGAGFVVPNCSLTANGNVEFEQAAMWIKADVSAWTTGTIAANVVGSR